MRNGLTIEEAMEKDGYFEFRQKVNPLYTRAMFEGEEPCRYVEHIWGKAEIWETKYGTAETCCGELLRCDIELGTYPYYHLVFSYLLLSGTKQIQVWKALGGNILLWQVNDPTYYDATRRFYHRKDAVKVIEDETVIRLMNKFKGKSKFERMVYDSVMATIEGGKNGRKGIEAKPD